MLMLMLMLMLMPMLMLMLLMMMRAWHKSGAMQAGRRELVRVPTKMNRGRASLCRSAMSGDRAKLASTVTVDQYPGCPEKCTCDGAKYNQGKVPGSPKK